jgi:hypothetical protein
VIGRPGHAFAISVLQRALDRRRVRVSADALEQLSRGALLEHTFSGPERGKGASYAWEGNAQVGKGRIAISAAKAFESVRYSVLFEQPLQTEMTYDFTIAAEGDGSKVSWVFQGEHPFWAKAFALFLDLDKQLGADMDKGLADLKALLEAEKS